jgi:RNA polymerase sigma-70 factor (ECF subfamily)
MAITMSSSGDADFVSRLSHAKSAGERDRYDLLETYRNYLLLLASLRSDRKLRSKSGDSDLVQETLIQASRDFDQFRGHSESELMGWLLAIMGKKKADLGRRYYGTAARDPRREAQLHDEIEKSSQLLDRAFVAYGSSPSQHLIRRERAVLLADALASLPDHYREVIVLHELNGYKLAEIAERMGRSVDSVKKLWTRGIIQLRSTMKRLS